VGSTHESVRYLHQGDVDRLLRGHYSPVLAVIEIPAVSA
jgi:hypothetical protein